LLIKSWEIIAKPKYTIADQNRIDLSLGSFCSVPSSSDDVISDMIATNLLSMLEFF
jgi:hypothetical protein